MIASTGALLFLLALPGAGVEPPSPIADARAPILNEIGWDQHLGQSVPLDALFTDEAGRRVPLRDFLKGRPVVLALNYFECPMLCTVSLQGLVSAMNVISFDAGRDYDVLTVSFDPKETSAQAAAKKRGYLERYKRAGADQGWRFLTGDASSIDALTKAVGFRYAWDEESKQFAHPAGVVVLSPDGRIARYLFGIEYAPRDLRFALVEASEGKIGTPVDAAILYCYKYDPATGRYGAAVMKILRTLGIVTVASILAFILAMRRNEKRALAHGRVS